MTDVHINIVDEDMLDTILARDVSFSGDLSFAKPLMIKGRFEGSIESTSDLFVDEGAEVNADIRARDVSVKGIVRGNIAATGKVELFASSRVEGDIVAPSVAMETGCQLKGTCTTTGSEDASWA